jgi:pimeloyl-ACP methyl ester carboxylesterase
MSAAHLLPWQQRPYGWRAFGVVEAEDRNVNIAIRQPEPYIEPSGLTVIMVNGWTAGRNSMRTPAIAATEFGHRAVTLEYTNTSGEPGALNQNVQDVLSVVKAQPKEAKLALMGLSMGGAVVTMALEALRQEQLAESGKPARVRRPVPQVETANLIAPAKYILPQYINEYEVARRFFAEIKEVTQIGKNPLLAAHIGFTSLVNCVRRPSAVFAELSELLRGTVHEELRNVMTEQANPPFVRISLPINDRLLPFFAQMASIEELPFSDIRKIRGGHGGLAYTPNLARELFALDIQRGKSGPPRKPSTIALPEAA